MAEYCKTCMKPYPDLDSHGMHYGHDVVESDVVYICVLCGNASESKDDIPGHVSNAHLGLPPRTSVAHWHYFSSVYPPMGVKNADT